MTFPHKEENKDNCTWCLNYYNRFTISEKGLTGYIGNFREGGQIGMNLHSSDSWSLDDIISEKPLLGWGRNSIFSYCGNDDDVVIQNVREEMREYAKQLKNKNH